MTGNVTRWEPGKGFGFLCTAERSDVFFHVTDFVDRPEEIEVGILLMFELAKTTRGLRAVRITAVETEED